MGAPLVNPLTQRKGNDMGTAYAFFLANAGYSYDPARETPLDGRRRGARALANAEKLARADGYSFEWITDLDITSEDWTDEQPAWGTWCCLMREPAGAVVASLGGIDFGRDGSPWGAPYRRVVEAELAVEVFHD